MGQGLINHKIMIKQAIPTSKEKLVRAEHDGISA
jgi:hypothetical protein